MNEPGIDFPWLRRIRVTFEGMTGNARDVYESDGTHENARIIARISKTLQSLPAATTLMLYNLSPETRRSLQKGSIKVKIDAGWDQGPFKGLRQCFYGSLLTSYSIRAGADIVTSITAMSMAEDIAKAWHNYTWGAKTPVMTIVEDLVAKLENVKIDRARIKGLEGKYVGDGGWSHSDSVRSALERLSREFGFSWTITDGCFQAVKDLKSFGGNEVIEDQYLIDVNPILSGNGISQTVQGLKIRCTFRATVNPAFDLRVNSKISPEYNSGTYYALSIAHELDCFNANSFITEIDTRDKKVTG